MLASNTTDWITAIGSAFAAVGTVGAVIVALWQVRRMDKRRMKISCYVGTIFTSGPTPALPYGLVSKVIRVRRESRGQVQVSLRAVPISEAIPELEFSGALPLMLPPGTPSATSARAQPRAATASSCSGPSLFAPHAHLDSVELREASLGALPPQLRLTLAVRTTESLGVSAAAIGINCTWQLGEIGPYQGAFPRRFCMFCGWFEGSKRVAPPSGYASSAASMPGGNSRVAAVICGAFRGA